MDASETMFPNEHMIEGARVRIEIIDSSSGEFMKQFYATSRDVPGLHVAASIENGWDIKERIVAGIKALRWLNQNVPVVPT